MLFKAMLGSSGVPPDKWPEMMSMTYSLLDVAQSLSSSGAGAPKPLVILINSLPFGHWLCQREELSANNVTETDDLFPVEEPKIIHEARVSTEEKPNQEFPSTKAHKLG